MPKATFTVVGTQPVTPPDSTRQIKPGGAGSTGDEAWVERQERSGAIRRTDGRSVVFPERHRSETAEPTEEASGDSD